MVLDKISRCRKCCMKDSQWSVGGRVLLDATLGTVNGSLTSSCRVEFTLNAFVVNCNLAQRFAQRPVQVDLRGKKNACARLVYWKV